MPIKKTEVVVSPGHTIETVVEVQPEAQEEDVRYFELSKPITVGSTEIKKLLLDPTELAGPVYFRLVGRFRKEYPEIYRQSFNKLGEEIFLAYVIAELNPPMTTEDLQKVSFVDIPVIFMRVQALAFRNRTE
jgi:hypothetical protein